VKRPSITQVENAFQPAKEANVASRFAGRKQHVKDSYYGMIADGAHIAIVGNRGIGKTSLARQIGQIASGNNELLLKLNIPHDGMLDYLTVYLACGESISCTGELLERLLTSSKCLGDWIYDIPKASKEMKSYNPKFGVNIMGAEVGLGGEKSSQVTTERAITSHPIETVFMNTLDAMVEAKLASNGILIVIDEFDRIEDPSGFAAFLKALSTNVPQVKFCIVGVAQDIFNLMKEHKSTDRLFAGTIIPLPSMEDDELKEIIRIAEKSIASYIEFDDNATKRLVALAQGHPYMIHLVGKYSLRLAFEENQRVITSEAISRAVKSIAERGADPVLEGRYKKAVASSPQREIVLKALADTRDEHGEIWTSNAYKIALDNGVDNSSQYVGQLVTEEYGGEIEKLRERYYRFHDSLFTAYVLARPPMFAK